MPPPPPPISDTPLQGIRPQAVIDALRARLQRQQAGQPIADGKTIALVVEGGSMRGAYSAGGMMALARLGYADLFDRIYATSAGVMNASYFLSHQPDLGISVYFDSLTNPRFWRPWRLWKMLDIDWLFDQVIARDKPLDVARVMASPTKMFVTLMDRGGNPHVVHVQASREPLLQLLKAAVAVPVFYNRCVTIDGIPCMDGGLLNSVPLEPAITDGCTDILVLTTHPKEREPDAPAWWMRQVFNILCARTNRPLAATFANHHVRDRAILALATQIPDAVHPQPNIALVNPVESEIHAWSFDKRETLIAGAAHYEKIMHDLMTR